ncbi:DgyrCDS3599 [Dimorphilus gyrociliatus]|uniref:DgyrCDS3599 n=1 Tax=Dimorphilus gyrociliatus TaxID=2664684 RepID=A0A7I8VEA9_9ANNE|nr:DgyrCDS3599 [Dimorphilus gyrociliatus]
MLEIIKAQRRRKLFSLVGSTDRLKDHVEVIQAFNDIEYIGKTSLSKHYPLKSILYWIAGELSLRNDETSKISIHFTKNSVRLLDTKEQFMYEYGLKDVYFEKVPNEETTVAFIVAFNDADSDCYICKLPKPQMIKEITSILGDGTRFEQDYKVIVEPLPGHVNEVLFVGKDPLETKNISSEYLDEFINLKRNNISNASDLFDSSFDSGNESKDDIQSSEMNDCRKPMTMLFQIQHDQICCINLHRNIAQFNRKFKDIAHCTQGKINDNHFGIVARVPQNLKLCMYVFQCATAKNVTDIMALLQRAFKNAYESSRRKNNDICTRCPIYRFGQYCNLLQGRNQEEISIVLTKIINGLSKIEQSTIQTKLKNSNSLDEKHRLTVLISLIKDLVEEKQKSHLHENLDNITDTSPPKPFQLFDRNENSDELDSSFGSVRKRSISDESEDKTPSKPTANLRPRPSFLNTSPDIMVRRCRTLPYRFGRRIIASDTEDKSDGSEDEISTKSITRAMSQPTTPVVANGNHFMFSSSSKRAWRTSILQTVVTPVTLPNLCKEGI